MGALQIFFYLSLVVFVVGLAMKMIKLGRMPLHLRWDLYPIPHEKGKGHYGGSYYEEVDWWTKPAEVSISGEITEMAKEIIFIQSMFHNNRSLWIFSFPFHFGLYLSVGFVVMVYLGAILGMFDVTVAGEGTGFVGMAVYYLTMLLGVLGAAIGCFGAIGLLLSRMFKSELRRTANWTDYFNLLLLAAVFASTLWVFFTVDSTFDSARAFVTSLVTFDSVGALTTQATVHFWLSAAFLFWMPFTHMTHMVGKYFTYHKVRWEDHPNIRGSKLEHAVENSLGYKLSWAAPHIKSGGTWAEAATATDNDEGSDK